MEQELMILGAAIYGLLGSAHLLLTFFSNKFEAHDPAVTQGMRDSTLVLTRDTTVWRARIGFNASHSLGALLVPGFLIPLAIQDFQVIEQSLWFTVLPSFISLGYLILAWRYWFIIPLVGTAVATATFITAAILILL